MGILDKIMSWFVTDDDILRANGNTLSAKADVKFVAPSELTSENVLIALQQYGRAAGFDLNADVERHKGNALMSSIRNQVIKLHEEILKYYGKQNQMPDEKLLNMLTVVNTFYISMGSAILAKVKYSHLITQGVFQKLLKKSGPDLFYREVAAMAGNKYGSEDVEVLHQHVQRAAYLLLLECDKHADSHNKVMECAKAMYMYGLCITLKEKATEAL
ncbi:MAG: hypothetical protein KBT20_07725 [Bacteroidales bacterium]|nr:hypothetical protein [Candidatus Liminaster caballi]